MSTEEEKGTSGVKAIPMADELPDYEWADVLAKTKRVCDNPPGVLNLCRCYQELRQPDSCEAGFEYGGVDSGEIGLKLHLDGKSGTVYVSAEMLRAILDRAQEDGFTMEESNS